MARPLIRRRIKVTGRQRTDIDADLLIQALIQLAEDEATQAAPDTTDPTVRTRAGTRPNRTGATGSRTRPMTSTTAPAPNRPAARTPRTSRGRSSQPGMNHQHQRTS
jgi:hypothetical protein